MILLAFALSSFLQAPEDAARRSVERGLAFLEKEGVAWIRERGCLSCHHVPFLLWSHQEARGRGLAVDPKKLAEWTAWSRKDELAQQLDRIKLTEPDLEAFKAGAIDPETVARLAPLAQKPSTTEAAFAGDLAKILSPEELASHKDDLFRHLPREKGDGGGTATMSFLLLSSVFGAGESDVLSATRARIRELQQPDGSWKPGGGQLFAMKRSAAETIEVTTMWAMIALEEASPNALAFVKKTAPGKSNEWLAARMIVERKFGDAGAFEGFRRDLLARQKADGGWSWIQDNAADPLATGLALYALTVVGGIDDTVAGKARAFLTQTQMEDGSWTLEGLTARPKPSKDPIYRYWGTAWAAIGLARTLPEITGDAKTTPRR
jgi:hypothetical protein